MKIRAPLIPLIAIGALLMASFESRAVDARKTPVAPFRTQCKMSDSSESLGRCTLSKSVPAGKRLVLETVTGAYYGDGAVLGAAYLTIKAANEFVEYAFPWVQSGALTSNSSDRRFYGFNHYVQLYVNGPASLQFDAAGGAFTGSAHYSGWYSVSGYLVDLP
jgi:hypothetical protein